MSDQTVDTIPDPDVEAQDPEQLDELDVEVLDGKGHNLPATTREDAAITAAAAAALELPRSPDRDEFLALCLQARVMADASIVPKALQGRPHDVLIVLMTGRDLGIPVTSAMRKVYVIDGQPSIAPQLKLARIRQLGLGAIRPGQSNDTMAEAIPLGPDGAQLGPTVVFSWSDAQRAGLVRHDCDPWQHSQVCDRLTSAKTRNGGQCKSNWRAYPQRMLWARASGYAADDYFPEATLGLYSPDELGALTDADGLPIDVDSVEVPDGFDRSRGEAADPADVPAPLAELQDLHVTILALPDDLRQELQGVWREKLSPIGMLSVAGLRLGTAIVAGFVSRARKVEGWSQRDAETAVRAAREAGYVRLVGDPDPDASEPAGAPEAPDTPADAPQDDTDTTRPAWEALDRDALAVIAERVGAMSEGELVDYCAEHGLLLHEPDPDVGVMMRAVGQHQAERHAAAAEPTEDPPTEPTEVENGEPFTDQQ